MPKVYPITLSSRLRGYLEGFGCFFSQSPPGLIAGATMKCGTSSGLAENSQNSDTTVILINYQQSAKIHLHSLATIVPPTVLSRYGLSGQVLVTARSNLSRLPASELRTFRSPFILPSWIALEALGIALDSLATAILSFKFS